MAACVPISSPFPYTTLFRSRDGRLRSPDGGLLRRRRRERREDSTRDPLLRAAREEGRDRRTLHDGLSLRSEEHTSELQSPCNLVCRLLLEKKNKTTCNTSAC